MNAEAISNILKGKPKAGGGFIGHCPAHDDRTPSLSIDDGDNGRPLVNCLAGCPQNAVIDALRNLGAWEDTTPTLSPAELQAMKEKAERAKAERLKADGIKHAKAEKEAKTILENAKEDPAQHDYNIKKGLPLGDQVKRGAWPQKGWLDALLFPIYSSSGTVTSIQAINPDSTKDFLARGRIKGCFYPIGKISGATGLIVIGEGVATVAAVCEVKACPGVAAMSAGNLEAVAKEIRKIAPDAEIIIIADDDQKADGTNPGREAAMKAAAAIRCKWVIPALGEKADAWDVLNELGADGIRAMMAAARELAGVPPKGTSEEWAEPEPLISHTESALYPLEALPTTIREAVREVIAFVQCPVALAACSALSAVSSVAQSFVDVRRDHNLDGPIGLYLLSIGESGERKSKVDSFFTSPIEAWEIETKERYAPMIRKHKAQFDAWEAERSGLLTLIRDKGKKTLDTKEEYDKLFALNDKVPQAPIVPRILYADTTPEKISRNLSTAWPVAGIISSEAGVVFGGHAMGKDSAMRNMSALNVFWDGKTVSTDRQTSESYSGRAARVTMGLSVQPETVRAFIDASKGMARGIGFLARFLVAWPASTQGWRLYRRSEEIWPNLDAFQLRMTSLLKSEMPIDEVGNITPTMLKLSESAFNMWIQFHDDIEVELRPGREMAEAKDIASKCADNAARIAGNFHLFEGAEIGEPISEATMRAACTVAEWHLFEAKRFLGEVALPVEIGNAAKLDNWLLAYCKDQGIDFTSTGNVQRHAPGCVRQKLVFDAAVSELVELGRIRVVKEGKKKIIYVNPALLKVE